MPLLGSPNGRSLLGAMDRLPGGFLVPIMMIPQRKREGTTLITSLEQLDHARAVSRLLLESNPNAQGLMRGLKVYVVSGGSQTILAPVDDDSGDPPQRLQRDVLRVLNSFKKANSWRALELEIFERLHRDGEIIVRFFPTEDGVTLIRFIDPATVRPPKDEKDTPSWSWGIQTDDDDVQTVIAYCVHYGDEEDIIPAEQILHVRINCDSTSKRGVPSFYSIAEDLNGASELRYAAREGEKVRQSIAYLREHMEAPESALTELRSENADLSLERYSHEGNFLTRFYQAVEPGEVHDVPEGLTYKPGPQGGQGGAVEVLLDKSYQAAAARFIAPIWLVNSDTGQTNFAASLTGESPFVKSVGMEQEMMSETVDLLQTRVVEIAIAQDELPDDTLERVDLQITFPSPVVRNRKEETGRHQVLNENRILSRKTWTAREDLDWDEEQRNLGEETGTGPADGGTDPGPAPSPTPSADYRRLTGGAE